MASLSSFMFISLDGYYKGENDDISWHRHGPEENEYAMKAMQSDNVLVFGRITYTLMSSYWPTPMARENDPAVAQGMNSSEKIVFSNTLKKADWENTSLIKTDAVAAMKKLKQFSGKDMVILGSGNLVTQLADAGLIDTFIVMVDPVVLGKGTTLFKGIKSKLDLQLMESRTFKSGVVLMFYQPLKNKLTAFS
jgi:dihydrofolate reductase